MTEKRKTFYEGARLEVLAISEDIITTSGQTAFGFVDLDGWAQIEESSWSVDEWN